MNTMQKILVATDFSESSEKALELACGIAKMREATMIIEHVYPVPSSDDGEGMLHAGLASEGPDDFKRRLYAIVPSVEGVEVQH